MPFELIEEVVSCDVNNVYIKCMNECYRQTAGGPMGSNLMVALSNIFGLAVEEAHNYDDRILLVARFVDDVIFIWEPESEDQAYPPGISKDFYPGCELNFEKVDESGTKYLGMEIRVVADGRMVEARSAVSVEKTMKSLAGSFLKDHELAATRKSIEHHHLTHRTRF